MVISLGYNCFELTFELLGEREMLLFTYESKATFKQVTVHFDKRKFS